jgi:pimeloyl-ACP methyl ester carboxylesterase
MQTTGRGMPVLFLHGNSSCKEAFRKQFGGEAADSYRLIAFDLPGHGASSDAFDPRRTYSMPGYADVAMEVLAALGVDRAAIVGWSLGGHIALEMLAAWPGAVGAMICGTPPVRRDAPSIQMGFQPNPAVFLAGKNVFTAEDYAAFAELTLGKFANDPELKQALQRTDGNARQMMFESLLAGQASDQRQIAETSTLPLAVVNGEKDPLVNLAYIAGVAYRALWEKHCFVLRGLSHVPFLDAPEVFNPLFARFAADMAKRHAKDGSRILTKRAKGAAA